MKRVLARVLLAVILITCLIPTAAAAAIEPYASDYFDDCKVTVTAISGGSLQIDAKATAKGTMSKIGVSEITIQKKGLIFWSDETTQIGTTANGLIKTNSKSYDKIITFSGLTVGEQYRAVVTFYAENSSGSDSITKTSVSVTAK